MKMRLAQIVLLALLLISPLWAAEENEQRLGPPELKKALQDAGYTVKEINTEAGKEKFEIQITLPDFNVPMGVEISPSKRYIWLTVNLGQGLDASKDPATRYESLLKANGRIQPCQFYITSRGNLMMALGLENRSLQHPQIRQSIEKLSKDVSEQSSVWKAPK